MVEKLECPSHKDFQLNKHGFTAAGGGDNHRIAVDKASAKPDDEVAGHGVSAVTNAARYENFLGCLLYTSPSPRDTERSRMPSSA